MFQVAIIYSDSGKKYTFPQELLEQYVDEQTLARIKTGILKEIQKL